MLNERMLTSKPEKKESIEEQQDYIKVPDECYFIHGVKDWTKKHSIGVRTPEISCSLQKDTHTQPIRPYGYILKLDKGAISGAYDRDVTSRYHDTSFKKKLSEQTRGKQYKNYNEDELEDLIENTKKKSHNELWVDGEMVEVIGAYVNKKKMEASGTRAFIKACNRDNVSIHWVE